MINNHTMDIEHFLSGDLILQDVNQTTIPKGSKITNQYTRNGLCGIVIPIRGKAQYKVDQTNYMLEKGNILFAGSHLPLDKEVIGDQEWEYYLIHYQIKSYRVKNPLMEAHFKMNIGEDYSIELYQRLQQLIANKRSNTPISKFKNKALLIDLIHQVYECKKWNSWTTEEELIDQSREFIRDNFHRELLISELAEMAGLDNKKYCYLFSKHTSVSPKQYLTSIRMKKAADLLLKEKCTITEISYMVGYMDVFNFSRMFKKVHGLSPSHFKEAVRKNT